MFRFILLVLCFIVTACGSDLGPPPNPDQGIYFLQPLPLKAVPDTSKLVLRSDLTYTMHLLGKADRVGVWSLSCGVITLDSSVGMYVLNRITIPWNGGTLTFSR